MKISRPEGMSRKIKVEKIRVEKFKVEKNQSWKNQNWKNQSWKNQSWKIQSSSSSSIIMDIPDTQLKIWLSNYHKFIWVRPNLGNTINLLDGSQHCCGANKVVIVVEECVDCWIAINVVCSSNVFCARAGKQSVFNSLYPTSAWKYIIRIL